jgi:hypothetical protein
MFGFVGCSQLELVPDIFGEIANFVIRSLRKESVPAQSRQVLCHQAEYGPKTDLIPKPNPVTCSSASATELRSMMMQDHVNATPRAP